MNAHVTLPERKPAPLLWSDARRRLAEQIAIVAEADAKAVKASKATARLREQLLVSQQTLDEHERALAEIDSQRATTIAGHAKDEATEILLTKPAGSAKVEAAIQSAARTCAAVQMAIEECAADEIAASRDAQRVRKVLDGFLIPVVAEEILLAAARRARARDQFVAADEALNSLLESLAERGRRRQASEPGVGLLSLKLATNSMETAGKMREPVSDLTFGQFDALVAKWTAYFARLEADAGTYFFG